MESHIIRVTGPAYGKKCQKFGKENHFKVVCKSNKHDPSTSRYNLKKGKGKRFYEVNEQNNDEVMVTSHDQVQSLLYNDIHFNSVNTRMHISIKCQTPDGKTCSQTFKIDTGADGNLMPITMFTKLFPQVSLDTLSRMIEKGVTLFAYNNTPIKQYGTCSIILSFKGKSFICKFFIVKHETAIVGINDSEKLKLVKVNSDMIKGVKVVHEITQESFKHEIEKGYSDLFKGIGLMKSEISIKLKDGAIPHIELVRRVPHVMQEPLKAELDKLVDEKILHKVDISEPIEWLNSFVCVQKANGKIRLCLDLTHLNKWIIRPRHSAKLVDDVLHKPNGAKYFTVMDSTSSFFNHMLDEESSKLTTFGTPFGHAKGT